MENRSIEASLVKIDKSRSDEPKSLRDPHILRERLAMLRETHIAPLTALVESIRREHPGAIVPYFDPLDGGINARVLFLLEAPGPKAKNFISRNNPDETAKNMFELQKEAGIARSDAIFWNVVPWYIGKGNRIRISRASDFDEGRAALERLISLLWRLQAVVLLGGRAQAAWKRAKISVPGVVVHKTHHTSPMSLNTNANRRHEVRGKFRQIAAALLP